MQTTLTYTLIENNGYFYDMENWPYTLLVTGYTGYGQQLVTQDERIKEVLTENNIECAGMGRPYNRLFFKTKEDAVTFRMAV